MLEVDATLLGEAAARRLALLFRGGVECRSWYKLLSHTARLSDGWEPLYWLSIDSRSFLSKRG
ncbi:hypothetical protein SAMN02745108_01031 [Fibrobacter intestinalis]|uniref:Uncharacterized protein n=1 Tax=Fibrobacter intestinalis TaxID=28122 RepID=A0A1T4LVG9_9BACT|nr:hypothetical protein SAMN02745108_01031 [Fibrobacter intestinalis]